MPQPAGRFALLWHCGLVAHRKRALASASAEARPMPLPEPVTSAILPCSDGTTEEEQSVRRA
eukprot:scaffold86635_cov60-Phaeocystis_antarctica.AAC.1